MPSRARNAVAPLYLLACLILGGSEQASWQNALLQLTGIAIIAWAAASLPREPIPTRVRMLLFLVIAAIALVGLQQLPVPASVWGHGPRARIAENYHVLGRLVPSLPISLTPYESLTTLLCLIPPVAMFLAVTRLQAFRINWLVAALLGGTVTAIMLGAAQVASRPPNLLWYPYSATNAGSALGFFADSNHMATLLLIALPFLAAIAAAARKDNVHRSWALFFLAGLLGILVIVAIALTGSLAGYALLVPMLVSSALLVLPRRSVLRWASITVALLFVFAAAAALLFSSIAGGRIGQDAATAVQSREVILENTSKALADYMPLGSGLGSFRRVYRLYERPQVVTSENVIHADNDYAELAVELGVPGIFLMLLFFVWWIFSLRAVWRTGTCEPFARAASIASGAILVQSLVDFPLRTDAISVCFAMCLGLLAARPRPSPPQSPQLRPARHLVFE